MDSEKAKIKLSYVRPLPFDEIRVKPAFVFDKIVEHKKGGSQNPLHWRVNVAGYPIVNAVVYVKGKPSQDFYILVDYAVANLFELQITNLGAGTTDPVVGSQVLQLGAYRPMMPEFTLIVTSATPVDFDTVCITLYATAA